MWKEGTICVNIRSRLLVEEEDGGRAEGRNGKLVLESLNLRAAVTNTGFRDQLYRNVIPSSANGHPAIEVIESSIDKRAEWIAASGEAGARLSAGSCSMTR